MGVKGNQAYDGRGMMTEIPTVPDFLVRFWLNITIAQVKGGGVASWYAPNMEACWDQKTRKVREMSILLTRMCCIVLHRTARTTKPRAS